MALIASYVINFIAETLTYTQQTLLYTQHTLHDRYIFFSYFKQSFASKIHKTTRMKYNSYAVFALCLIVDLRL